MSRPRLAIGEWGEIHRGYSSRGLPQALVRYRGSDGELHKLMRTGPNHAAAERALRVALEELSKEMRRAEVGSTTTMAELCDMWLEELRGDVVTSRKQQTKEKYEKLLESEIVPRFGARLVGDMKVRPIEKWAREIAAEHPTKARHCLVVLKGVLSLAVRYDILPGNPVASVELRSKRREHPDALEPHDVATILRALRMYVDPPEEFAPDGKRQPRRPGPRNPGLTLYHVMVLLVGTGCRIGEILALTWDNVNLASAVPTIHIDGTIVEVDGTLVRQDETKTKRERTLAIPPDAVAVLSERQGSAKPNPRDLVFATRTGRPIADSNLLRPWKSMRDELGYPDVTPHTIRRTVATRITDLIGIEAAQRQLGHVSSTTTERFYVAAMASVVNNRRVMDDFLAAAYD
jgi:integrase